MSNIEDVIKNTRELQREQINKAFVNDEEVVEKSDIFDALSYNNDIKVSKTGKEIKTQVKDKILPELTAALIEVQSEADDKLGDCGQAPTMVPDKWWTNGIKMDIDGYKIYGWSETYIPRGNEDRIVDTLSASDAASKKKNIPENDEQAKSRNEYNELVRRICEIKVDIKMCDILGELDDNKTFELSPRQVLALKF